MAAVSGFLSTVIVLYNGETLPFSTTKIFNKRFRIIERVLLFVSFDSSVISITY